MGIFDELLSQLPEEDRGVIAKHPVLRTKYEEMDSLVSQWEAWRDKEYDPDTKMTRTALEALKAKDQELEVLRLSQGADNMTWEEMQQNLTKSGYVTKDQLAAEAAKLPFAKPDDVKKLDEGLNNLGRGMEVTYTETANLPLQYFQEFGEVHPTLLKDLFKYMGDKKIQDFHVAYDGLVAEKRTAKATEAKAKEAEAQKAREEEIRKEAREEAKKEFAMKSGSLPVDDGGSVQNLGFLQARKLKAEPADGTPKLTPGKIGDQTAAHDAYQAYLKDLADGKKPTSVQ